LEDFLKSPAKVFTSAAKFVDDFVRGVGRWRFSDPISEDIEGLEGRGLLADFLISPTLLLSSIL
jgi:hypothetical protein